MLRIASHGTKGKDTHLIVISLFQISIGPSGQERSNIRFFLFTGKDMPCGSRLLFLIKAAFPIKNENIDRLELQSSTVEATRTVVYAQELFSALLYSGTRYPIMSATDPQVPVITVKEATAPPPSPPAAGAGSIPSERSKNPLSSVANTANQILFKVRLFVSERERVV